MKLYVGKRQGDNSATAFIKLDGQIKVLNPRFDLREHSPTGFEWGYLGSGPAQLSLAILCDALRDDDRAIALYQDFKKRFIAIQPMQGFSMTHEEVLQAAATLETETKGENHG